MFNPRPAYRTEPRRKPNTVSDSLYPRQFVETAGMGVAVLTELWSGVSIPRDLALQDVGINESTSSYFEGNITAMGVVL